MTLNRNPENFFAADRAGGLRAERGSAWDRLQPRQDAARPCVLVRRHAPSPDRAELPAAPGQPAPRRGEHLHPGRADGLRAPRRRTRSTHRTRSVAGTPTRSVRSTRAGRPTAPWCARPTRCARTTTTSVRPARWSARSGTTRSARPSCKTVAGHLLGGVEGDVLERAFEYWRNVDAECAKKIEELVRQGADAGAPGAQPGEAAGRRLVAGRGGPHTRRQVGVRGGADPGRDHRSRSRDQPRTAPVPDDHLRPALRRPAGVIVACAPLLSDIVVARERPSGR